MRSAELDDEIFWLQAAEERLGKIDAFLEQAMYWIRKTRRGGHRHDPVDQKPNRVHRGSHGHRRAGAGSGS